MNAQGLQMLFESGDPRLASLVHEAASKVERDNMVRDLRRIQPVAVATFETEVATLLRNLGERVATAAYPLINNDHIMERKWKTSLTTGDVEALVEQILTTSQLRTWVGSNLTPAFWLHHERVMKATAHVMIKNGMMTNITKTTMARYLAAGGRRAGLVDITGDTRKALFRVINQGIDLGMSPRQTAKLMRDLVPEGRFVNAGADYRASLIARTETLHAQRSATLDRYRANNVNKVMAYDGDSDPVCLARNGMEYTLTQAEDEMLNTHPQCVLCFAPGGTW